MTDHWSSILRNGKTEPLSRFSKFLDDAITLHIHSSSQQRAVYLEIEGGRGGFIFIKVFWKIITLAFLFLSRCYIYTKPVTALYQLLISFICLRNMCLTFLNFFQLPFYLVLLRMFCWISCHIEVFLTIFEIFDHWLYFHLFFSLVPHWSLPVWWNWQAMCDFQSGGGGRFQSGNFKLWGGGSCEYIFSVIPDFAILFWLLNQ